MSSSVCRLAVCYRGHLALHRGVHVNSGEDLADNLVDGTESEWWTESETAWIEVNLQELCSVTSIKIHWWGFSVAKSFKILSSSDGLHFTQQRSELDAVADGEECNPWCHIPGWDDTTTHIRVELADGQQDPWGMNKWFGMRSLQVLGRKGALKNV